MDAKTRAQLDEYLADKNKSNGSEVISISIFVLSFKIINTLKNDILIINCSRNLKVALNL